MAWYRVTVSNIGIYEAVERDCSRDDIRRRNKPDGSWLPKVGTKYPGAISYWTELGWKMYNESGLYDWHRSVVRGDVRVDRVDESPKNILYKDDYQAIAANDILENKGGSD